METESMVVRPELLGKLVFGSLIYALCSVPVLLDALNVWHGLIGTIDYRILIGKVLHIYVAVVLAVFNWP